MTISEGDAFRYDGTGPQHDVGRSHIHVVVKIDYETGDVYLVPISSAHAKCDKTCVFPAKRWSEELAHESHAEYYHAKKVPLKPLLQKIEAGEVEILRSVPGDLFTDILEGIKKSPEVEPWFSKHF